MTEKTEHVIKMKLGYNGRKPNIHVSTICQILVYYKHASYQHVHHMTVQIWYGPVRNFFGLSNPFFSKHPRISFVLSMNNKRPTFPMSNYLNLQNDFSTNDYEVAPLFLLVI